MGTRYTWKHGGGLSHLDSVTVKPSCFNCKTLTSPRFSQVCRHCPFALLCWDCLLAQLRVGTKWHFNAHGAIEEVGYFLTLTADAITCSCKRVLDWEFMGPPLTTTPFTFRHVVDTHECQYCTAQGSSPAVRQHLLQGCRAITCVSCVAYLNDTSTMDYEQFYYHLRTPRHQQALQKQLELQRLEAERQQARSNPSWPDDQKATDLTESFLK